MVSSRSTTTEAVRPPDRRTIRRRETKAEIVAAAWELVREQGLAALSMRDLGHRVGMKAQSLYSYYDSKHAIYDAMFHQGYLAFLDEMAAVDSESSGSALERASAIAHGFFQFCTSDPVRYQLLFQRTIPDFVPSDESYAVAVRAYAAAVDRLSELGVADPDAVDLWTAMLTGITDQQISNDPGGDRWERLIDRAVAMTLGETAPQLFEQPKGPAT